jgi:hypothetical protein
MKLWSVKKGVAKHLNEFRMMTEESKFHDRRRDYRAPTLIPAVAKAANGMAQSVVINDLTTDGCAVTATGHPLIPGRVYGVKLDGLEGLVTTARWSAGARSGLQFDRPLHPAVADHIAARHKGLRGR